MKTVGIIAAMDLEMQALVERMDNARKEIHAGLPYYCGTLCGAPVVVCVCGVGKVNAAMHTQILIDRYAPDCIVQNGVAGSLQSSVGYFDLVVGSELVYHDMQPWAIEQFDPLQPVYYADPAMVTCITETIPGCKVGRIATGDLFVSGREEKARIAQQTHALCTEMEGCAVAHTATLNGVPFVVLRAISDLADGGAEEDFPTFAKKAANRAVDVLLALLPKLSSNK